MSRHEEFPDGAARELPFDTNNQRMVAAYADLIQLMLESFDSDQVAEQMLRHRVTISNWHGLCEQDLEIMSAAAMLDAFDLTSPLI